MTSITSFPEPKNYTPSTITATTTTTSTTLAPSTIHSASSSTINNNKTFLSPTATLQIQTQGKALFALPSPLRDLEIPIISTSTGQPVYISIKDKRSSGNCKLVLVDTESESEIKRVVVGTTRYFWAPGRNAVVRVNGLGMMRGGEGEEGRGEGDEFEIVGKGLVSRSMEFECKWGRFKWRYAGKKERGEGVNNLLVLEKIGGNGGTVRVAQLVRSEGTRTKGSKGSSAGNGGQLEIYLDGDREGEGEGKRGVIDEVTIVSTCLVMLKREVDRRRAMQVAMIAGAVSGGVH